MYFEIQKKDCKTMFCFLRIMNVSYLVYVKKPTK